MNDTIAIRTGVNMMFEFEVHDSNSAPNFLFTTEDTEFTEEEEMLITKGSMRNFILHFALFRWQCEFVFSPCSLPSVLNICLPPVRKLG